MDLEAEEIPKAVTDTRNGSTLLVRFFGDNTLYVVYIVILYVISAWKTKTCKMKAFGEVEIKKTKKSAAMEKAIAEATEWHSVFLQPQPAEATTTTTTSTTPLEENQQQQQQQDSQPLGSIFAAVKILSNKSKKRSREDTPPIDDDYKKTSTSPPEAKKAKKQDRIQFVFLPSNKVATFTSPIDTYFYDVAVGDATKRDDTEMTSCLYTNNTSMHIAKAVCKIHVHETMKVCVPLENMMKQAVKPTKLKETDTSNLNLIVYERASNHKCHHLGSAVVESSKSNNIGAQAYKNLSPILVLAGDEAVQLSVMHTKLAETPDCYALTLFKRKNKYAKQIPKDDEPRVAHMKNLIRKMASRLTNEKKDLFKVDFDCKASNACTYYFEYKPEFESRPLCSQSFAIHSSEAKDAGFFYELVIWTKFVKPSTTSNGDFYAHYYPLVWIPNIYVAPKAEFDSMETVKCEFTF